jgi:hypothetical protein
MSRDEPDFEPKAQDQKRQRRVAPRRARQCRHRIADRHAAVRNGRRHKYESHQQEGLAQHSECHIDNAGTPAGRGAVMNDKTPGRQTDYGVGQIKSHQVGGDKDTDTAEKGQQPPLGKASGVGVPAQVNRGVGTAQDPQQRRYPEQHRPG